LRSADLKVGQYKTHRGGYTAAFHWLVRPVSCNPIFPRSGCPEARLSILQIRRCLTELAL